MNYFPFNKQNHYYFPKTLDPQTQVFILIKFKIQETIFYVTFSKEKKTNIIDTS